VKGRGQCTAGRGILDDYRRVARVTVSTPHSQGGRGAIGIKPCVLIPTYDNERTIASVVRDSLEVCPDVFVVNDGATDNTPRILEELGGIVLLEHPTNRGKGAALLTGFREALERGFTHAVTLDSDGQHSAEKIAAFLEAARESPESIILGNRNFEGSGAGRGSRLGRKNSNFWTWVETGLRIPDTQTGFRCYPLESILDLHFVTTGFDFEIEVLIKAAWSGVKVESIPVPVRYFSGADRVSHLRPFVDFMRIARLNTRLVTMRLCLPPPYLELLVRREFRAKSRKERWRESCVELFQSEPGSPERAAISAGFGFFMGLTPLWGYQVILTLLLAHRLRLSKTVAVIASHISLPVLVPFIMYASLLFGRFLLGRDDGSVAVAIELETADLSAWLVGSFALAILTGVVGGTLVYLFLRNTRLLRTRGGARAR
jgi:glycosyltransferase involved in cell wall biosynthesis/uncharacterized protein (DUF2062 family)